MVCVQLIELFILFNVEYLTVQLLRAGSLLSFIQLFVLFVGRGVGVQLPRTRFVFSERLANQHLSSGCLLDIRVITLGRRYGFCVMYVRSSISYYL
jgi:hypothetical protein